MRFRPDPFLLVMLATVATASIFPCRGEVARVFGWLSIAAIALLFFLHGAKLSREAIFAGARHWRLHLTVLVVSFVLFPLMGWLLRPLLQPLVTPGLYVGVLFLCTLPSTVQASIAFTSIARGNVPAAVCSASASSLIGIVATPLLVGLLLAQHTGVSLGALRGVLLQLLLPLVLGQLARPWLAAWLEAHAAPMAMVDRSSILLVVYVAFSEAVIEGLWHRVPPTAIAALVLTCGVLLALSFGGTTLIARRLGFSREDEIAIVFCGSKKSLATGIPMARLLFAGHALGAVVLPLMLFHQLQLMVGAVLAQRYARQAVEVGGVPKIAPTGAVRH